MKNESGYFIKSGERDVLKAWLSSLDRSQERRLRVLSSRQDFGKLQPNASFIKERLQIGETSFDRGLGTHANSEIVLQSTCPLQHFRALAGFDRNRVNHKTTAEVVFSVWTGDQCLWESGGRFFQDEALAVDVDLRGAANFTLRTAARGTNHLAHVDWVNVEAVSTEGTIIPLGGLEKISPSLPVSFIYNAGSSEEWFCKWGTKHTTTPGDGFEEHLFVTHDLESEIICSINLKEYADLPACLWEVQFRNAGAVATPILEQVRTLDLQCFPNPGKRFLHRSRGSSHYVDEPFAADGFRDDFKLQRDLLKEQEITLGGVGGRSSVDWMPYFNLACQEEGLLFGVGWTGQWQSQIQAKAEGIRVQAGMENIRISLEPGESIRQPSILMIYWQGEDSLRGNNLLRRFINYQILPRFDGQPLQLPVSHLSWGGMIAASHLARIEKISAEKLPFDYYWIDAGWYGTTGPNDDEFSSEWGTQAGDWSVNRKTYPNDIRQVSDASHARGFKFLLWVEPERAVYGRPVTLEHPDWFLGAKKEGENVLLNLGNKEALSWCIELIASLVETQQLDCYRQDFNTSPLPFWQAADSAGRVGMTEIRYVEGLYAFLDELRRRFPFLLIDNCASGGRRLDFEMMRRSVPFWASDMQCFPDYLAEKNLQQVSGLSHWLPQFGFGTQEHPGDTYHFRSTLAAGMQVHLFAYERIPIHSDYPYDWLRERLFEYHRAKIFFTGDFHPLIEIDQSFASWSASQYDRPDLRKGMVLAFRKRESPIEKVRLGFRDLNPTGLYEIEDVDLNVIHRLSGHALMSEGLSVEITHQRGSKLFFYSEIGTAA